LAQQQTLTASIQCGRKIITVLVGIVCAVLIAGWIFEHLVEIETALNAAWGKLLFAMSLGGNFWAAVIIGLTMITIIGWACCVDNHLSKQNTAYSWPLIRIILISGAIWLLSFFAMQQTFHSIRDLTTYGRIAAAFMTLPFVVLALVAWVGCIKIMMHALGEDS
jgi:hypothetical protein